MPLLAGAILGLFSALVAFFAKIFTKRIALAAALLVAVIALTTALYTAVTGLLTGITYAMPSFVNNAMCWLMPDNLNECVTVIVAAKILEYGYIWNVRIVQWKLL